jgi:MoxR-like ATPase
VIAATANTVGQGDPSGLYGHGTKMQNYSQINRFSLTVSMHYMSARDETEMLRRRVPELTILEAERFVKTVTALRDGHINGQLSVPTSPRDLVNWADKFVHFGDPVRAARYSILNRMTPNDAVVAAQIVQRVFAGSLR